MCWLPGDEAEKGTDPGGPFSGGQVSLDFRGKLPGRGAYVCPNPACLAKARKSKALERAFSAPLPEEVYQALEEQMKEVPQDAQ